MAERLRCVVKRFAHTQSLFAERLGVTQGAVSMWIKRGSVSSEAIMKMKEVYPNLNIDWLLTGKGEMLINNNSRSARNVEQSESSTFCQSNNHSPYAVNKININNSDESLKYKILTPMEEFIKNSEYKPVVTPAMAKMPDFDVYEHLQEPKLEMEYTDINASFPQFDCFYVVMQDAMLPDYKPGDRLALSALKKGQIEVLDGSPMIVDTWKHGFIFRLIYDEDDYLNCVVTNKQSNYRDKRIAKSDVIRLYRVVGMIRVGM